MCRNEKEERRESSENVVEPRESANAKEDADAQGRYIKHRSHIIPHCWGEGEV